MRWWFPTDHPSTSYLRWTDCHKLPLSEWLTLPVHSYIRDTWQTKKEKKNFQWNSIVLRVHHLFYHISVLYLYVPTGEFHLYPVMLVTAGWSTELQIIYLFIKTNLEISPKLEHLPVDCTQCNNMNNITNPMNMQFHHNFLTHKLTS